MPWRTELRANSRNQTPTLLLWGRMDKVVSHVPAGDIAETIPDSSLISFPGIGHMPQEEAPQASIDAMLAFPAPPCATAGEAPARTDPVVATAAP